MTRVRAMPGILAASRRRTAAGGPPPAFRSQNSLSTSGGTSHNCPVPAGIAVGDQLVLFVHSWAGGAAATYTVSGWTSVGTTLNPGAAGDSFACFARTATGSEGATVTVTTNKAALANVVILAYSGSSGVDVTFSGGSTGTAPTVPSVTTTTANDIVVGLTGWAGGSSATPAAGWTERADHVGASSGSLVHAMDIVQAVAGATPTGTPTPTSPFGPSAAWAVALKP